MKVIIVVLLLCLGGGYLAVSGGSKNFNKVDWETASVGELKFLILLGADVNARNTTGATPLMLAAARNRDPDVIKALINAGADVNAKDNAGRTPLIWARKYNKNGAVIEVLKEATDNTGGYTSR